MSDIVLVKTLNGALAPADAEASTFIEKQNRNTRGTRMVVCDGESRSIIEWSELMGWPHHVIASRLRAGWSEQRAVSEPWQERKAKG